MATFRLKFKRNTESSPIGGFHADYLDKVYRPAETKSAPMGLGRVFGTATALILGGFMCYTAMHYIPAYSSKRIIALSKLASPELDLSEDKGSSIARKYLNSLRMRRAYLLEGQSMQVQYALPEDTKLEMKIIRCRSIFIFEVFKCIPAEETIGLISSDQFGTRKYTFKNKGFYLFDETVTHNRIPIEDYRVIWSRL